MKSAGNTEREEWLDWGGAGRSGVGGGVTSAGS